MSVTVRRVEEFTEENVNIATEVLHTAFLKDPFHLIAAGYDQAINRSMVLASVRGTFIGGELYFAEIDGKVVGAAGWFGPGRAMYDTDEAKQKAAAPHMANLTPNLRTWNVEYFRPEYQALTDKCFGSGYKLASYHLQTIGVLPEHQGKGVTRALVNFVRDKAHPQGIPLCLEAVTELNSRIYGRIGFKVVGEPGAFKAPEGVEGEFTFYCMVYEPQDKASSA